MTARACATCGADLSQAQDWVRHCPKCAGIQEEAESLYFSDRGYYLEFKKSRFAHAVGGRNELPGAVCNGHKCDRPFLRLLTLDLKDPKLSFIPALKHGPSLPLLYCWRCGGEPSYRLDPSGRVTVIGKSSTGPEKDFPYPDYPEFFPEQAVRLIAIPSAVQRRICEANARTIDKDVEFSPEFAPHMEPHHQVGGIPYLLEGDREPELCPQCEKPMPILGSACSESGSKMKFARNRFMQVVFEYCADCQIVHASYECD